MSDIHKVLSKHFAGEASSQEEILVQQFKRESPKEYNVYKAFLTKQEIKTSTFDTTEGWKQVTQKATTLKPAESDSKLKWLAGLAAIILLSVGAYLYLNQSSASEHITRVALAQNDKVILEDGSIIYLNKNATITYQKKLGSDKREVRLEGEAFFEITKDINRPFIVHTQHSEVEVLGTSFNINTNTNNTTVSVATGKVKVEGYKTKKTSLLTPNQAVVVTHRSQEETNVSENYLAWKTGLFNFKKTPISQAVAELNHYYNNKLVLANKESDCLLSSSFNQSDLTELLEIIELSCGLTSTKNNKVHELR